LSSNSADITIGAISVSGQGAAIRADHVTFHLSGHPEPYRSDIIDFTEEQHRHKHFFAREDIIADLDASLYLESGWVVISGGPGLGKSAILNRWLNMRQHADLTTAFHFVRRGHKNWAEPSAIRANLAAQIEQRFPEQHDSAAHPENRLEQLLDRVSKVLGERREKLVLLVDGLDEAMALDEKDNPIPRIFPLEVPPGVFVVVGSRPRYPNLNWFDRRTGPTRWLNLDARNESNRQAVREYWGSRRGELTEVPSADLVDVAVERAEGNLLHAVKLFELWSREDTERSVEGIPKGFEGLLTEFWERLALLPKSSRKLVHAGLAILCAARESLPFAIVEELLGWDPGDAQDEFLPLVREMLLEEHLHTVATYRPFHEGFRELIMSRLSALMRTSHEKLVGFATWSEKGNFRRSYALRHRVAHQLAMGEFVNASLTCREVEYLVAKAREFGVHEIEHELRCCARAQEPELRKQLEILAGAMAACAHLLREDPEALATLLHDRLLSFAPTVHSQLFWPASLHRYPRLRHPLQRGGLARVFVGSWGAIAALLDGQVVSISGGLLRVLDVDSARFTSNFEHRYDEVKAIAVLPGERICSGYRGCIRLWSIASGRRISKMGEGSAPIEAIAALADGRIVSASSAGDLRVWDVDSHKSLAFPVLSVTKALVTLPDGRRVATIHNRVVLVWDVDSRRPVVYLSGHGAKINELAVLPSGHIVSASEDSTLRIWDAGSGRSLATLDCPAGPVSGVAVTSDGHIVSSSSDGSVCVWKVSISESLVKTTHTHRYRNGGRGAIVTPFSDGAVALILTDGRIRVLNIESGEQREARVHAGRGIRIAKALSGGRLALVTSGGSNMVIVSLGRVPSLQEFEGHSGSITGIAELPDGRAITVSSDRTLRVWDVHSGECLSVRKEKEAIGDVAVLPDGRVITAALSCGTLQIWDGFSADLVTYGHSRAVTNIAVFPDGRRIVSASSDGSLCVWDVDSGCCLAAFGYPGSSVNAVVVVSDDRIVSASDDCVLRVWSVASASPIAVLQNNGVARVMAALPGGRIVCDSKDHTLCIWDLDTRQPIGFLEGHQDLVKTLTVLPDGRVLSVSNDDTLRIWDVESQQSAPASRQCHHRQVASVLALCEKGRVVSASFDNSLRVWDVKTGQSYITLNGHSRQVTSLARLPDGRIVSGSWDKTLRVWNIDSNQSHALFGHQLPVTAVDVLPDGRVVSASWDSTLRVWDVDSGQSQVLHGHQLPVTAVAALPNGCVISGSSDATLFLWDLKSGEPPIAMLGHEGSISSVALSPLERRVVSASSDHTLRIWDIDSGCSTMSLIGHGRAVTGVAVLPNGSVVSASDDKTLRGWDVRSGQCVFTVRGDASFNCIAVVDQCLIVAGDANGNVWFIDLPEPSAC
jgi:WD40 repeat protein